MRHGTPAERLLAEQQRSRQAAANRPHTLFAAGPKQRPDSGMPVAMEEVCWRASHIYIRAESVLVEPASLPCAAACPPHSYYDTSYGSLVVLMMMRQDDACRLHRLRRRRRRR